MSSEKLPDKAARTTALTNIGHCFWLRPALDPERHQSWPGALPSCSPKA